MSSGACRALVTVLLTLIVLPLLAVPVAANSERLREVAQTTYTVNPGDQSVKVTTIFGLENRQQTPYNKLPWGPIIVDEAANLRGLDVVGRRDVPGPWTAIEVATPVIEPGDKHRFSVSYTLDATRDDVPVRIDDGYLYFCVVGQDTDLGSITVRIQGRDRYDLTQSGTPLEITDRGLRSSGDSAPGEVFTCVEGTVDENLETTTLVGPAGREVVLQASPSDPNWLVAAQSNVEPTLDAITEFLGQDMPGQGPVIIRQTPPADELGGYASAHDSLGIVQLDDDAGIRAPEHELAHAWFGADNVTDRWLREGLAEWVATSMRGAECPPVDASAAAPDLADWQVVRPTAGDDIDAVMADQLQAACGIVSATRARMGEEQWQDVLGALLAGETKYAGGGGPTDAAASSIDYREWLDAVDEVGLIPAGQADPAFAANLQDLDYAQDLLSAYQIPTDPGALEQRSEARAAYHEFLASSGGLSAPLAVRQAMDDWEFGAAIESLAKSREVLASLQQIDAQLPDARLIPVIQPMFEAAASDDELDAVVARSQDLLASASQVLASLTELNTALPEGWVLPAAINDAIADQRFEDVQAAIPPALQVVSGVNAANAVLPEAGLLEKYRGRFESTATSTSLQELADAVSEEFAQAEQAGTSLRQLESEVGDWSIPSAVRQPLAEGRLEAAIPVLEDALAVVAATKAGDAALPDADLAAEFRPRFEAVVSAAELATLRSEAEAKARLAETVGAARTSLKQLAPEWQEPPILSEPIDQRDFETAAAVATVAQKWIIDAAAADKALPEISALEQAQPMFEGATTIADLEAGAQLAESWNTAAVSVRAALDATQRPLDLLGTLGMMGTDVSPLVAQAKDAAIEGRVEDAVNAAASVNATYHNASSVGGLRLAGMIFFVVAIVGVAGLWFLLRRQAGPAWARQRKPHWLKEQNPKADTKGGKAEPPRAIGPGREKR